MAHRIGNLEVQGSFSVDLVGKAVVRDGKVFEQGRKEAPKCDGPNAEDELDKGSCLHLEWSMQRARGNRSLEARSVLVCHAR